MSNIEEWIRSKVGCGYVYGATGWVCTPSRRNQQATQYPEHAENILGICAKWDGKECYDCAQLIRRALESVGVTGVPSGATSQWNKKSLWTESGTIDSLPSDSLVALCREANGKMQHIGWRMSDGSVIDARSSQKGVITSSVDSYKWTHWMRPNLAYNKEESDVLYKAIVSTAEHSMRVRAWAKTGEILGYVPTGKTVEVLAEDADNWKKIRYGELVGYASGNMMARIDADDTEKPTVDTEKPPVAAPTVGQTVLVSDDGVEITLMGNWRVMVNG